MGSFLVVPASAEATGPANDDVANATVITSMPRTIEQSTVGATLEPGESLCNTEGATVWFKYTMPFPGRLGANLVTSGWGPRISMYRGASPASWVPLGCQSSDGNAINIGTAPLSTAPADTYWFQVGAANGESGMLHIDFESEQTGESDPQPGAVVGGGGCNGAYTNNGYSPEVPLPFALNFFGTTYDTLFVNENGSVTFGRGYSYVPDTLNEVAPVIAPFFADVDSTRWEGGSVYYGYSDDIYEGKPAFCVDWRDVGYLYEGATSDTKRNRFQLLLVPRSDRGVGDFDIVFNYSQIEWESGYTQYPSYLGLGGKPPRAGYASGTGPSYELAGSGQNGEFLDSSPNGLIHRSLNSTVPGRFVFEVANNDPGCPNDADCDRLSDETERYAGTDPRNADTDDDGLLDSWEADPTLPGAGIYVPQTGGVVTAEEALGPFGREDGLCDPWIDNDLRYQQQFTCLNSPPDPLRKDVYVEIDWQDCRHGACPKAAFESDDPLHHAPNPEGLIDAVASFLDAPVPNPYGPEGVNLNILVDEAIPHAPNCLQSDDGSNLSREYFGTEEQRTIMRSDVILAKLLVSRYAWSGHSSAFQTVEGQSDPCENPSRFEFAKQGLGLADLEEYDWSPFGSVNIGGDFMAITLGPIWSCQSTVGKTNQIVTSGTLGPCFRESESNAPFGADFIGNIDPGIFPAHITPPYEQRRAVPHPIHRMMGEREADAARQLWSRTVTHLLGHALGIDREWHVHNQPAPAGRYQASAENQLTPLMPDHYESYFNLRWAPQGAGSWQVEEDPPNYDELADEDPDVDGVPERDDNCPGVFNPLQQNDDDGRWNLGHNKAEFGDACDPDIDGDGLANPLPGQGEGGSGGAQAAAEGEAAFTATTGEEDPYPYDTDNDAQPNAEDADDDGDGVADTADNCERAANAGQADLDADGLGDACDLDADDDGDPNGLEVAAGSDPLSASSHPEYAGLGGCADTADNDGDGTTDAADAGCVDADSDGWADAADLCPAVADQANRDTDEDGIGDACDLRVRVVSVSPRFLSAADSAYRVVFDSSHSGPYTVRQGGTSCSTGTVVASGSYTAPDALAVTVSAAGLPQGATALRACVTAISQTVAAPAEVYRDTVLPAVSAPNLTAASDTGSSSTDNVTNVGLPSLTGTAEPGAAITLTQDGAFAGRTTAAADGSWSLVPLGPVPEGVHRYVATATDPVRNAAVSDPLDVTIDRTAPESHFDVAPLDGGYARNATTFEFSAYEPATWQCSVDNAAYTACASPFTGPSGAGSHSLRIRGRDAAGNLEANGPSRTWTADIVAPTVQVTTPAQDAVYLRNATVAADYACTEEQGGSGLLGCVAPVADGAAIDTATTGTKTFWVNATDDVGNERVVSVTYTVVPDTPPTVTGLSPAGGVTAGGTVVTITGTDFAAPATVRFGTAQATNVVVESPTRIKATSPPGAAGTAQVTVTTPAGTSATGTGSAFLYGSLPTITSLTPNSVAAGQTILLVVNGADFIDGATKVVVDGGDPATHAVDPLLVTSTMLLVPISHPLCPGAAKVVDIRVVTTIGVSPTSAATKFTYGASPPVGC